MFLWTILALILALALWLFLYFTFSSRIGTNPKGERLARIQASPNYKEGKFQNVVETNMDMPFHVMRKVMWEMMKGGDGREPKDTIKTVPLDVKAWEAIPDTAFAVAWFGHSSLLIKAGGLTFLTDPVFGERASTFSFAGPKRFAYDRYMSVDQLPHVDVVLISHDHYDHLDEETIKELVAVSSSNRELRYITALGVGAHLEYWGVKADAITEKDWWESVEVGPVKLSLTPARHFSGRNLNNRFSTLWGGWVIEANGRKVYFGADSGYSPTFKEVGDRFGPFDLVLLECGAYNEFWANIHMMPEETAQAAKDLRAAVLMPVHWGKFSLALHHWKDPIQRLTKKSAELGVPLLTPRIGRIVVNADSAASEPWWEGVE